MKCEFSQFLVVCDIGEVKSDRKPSMTNSVSAPETKCWRDATLLKVTSLGSPDELSQKHIFIKMADKLYFVVTYG